MNRNILSLIVGGLIVAVGFLGYTAYQDHKQPEGVQISLDNKGLEIKGN
jgi:predicted negative regulator of RcsB-dependent stress response